MTQLSPHFTLHELTHSPTATGFAVDNTPPAEALEQLERLCAEVLEPWRAAVGPIRITSGYRSEQLNRMIGGSSTSDHMTGAAADCKPTTTTQDYAWGELLRLIRGGLPVRQAILYPGGQIHVAYGTTPSRSRLLVKTARGYSAWRPP